MRQSSKPMFFNKVYVVKELMVGGSWRRREGGRRGRENETTQRKGNPNFKSHKNPKALSNSLETPWFLEGR